MQQILDHHYIHIDNVLNSFEKVIEYITNDCIEDIEDNIDPIADHLRTIWKAGVHTEINDEHFKEDVNHTYSLLRKRRNDLIVQYCHHMDIENDTERCNIMNQLDTMTTMDLFDERLNPMIAISIPMVINSTTIHTYQHDRISKMIIELHRTYRYEDVNIKFYPRYKISPCFLELEWKTLYILSDIEEQYYRLLLNAIKYYRLDLGMNIDEDYIQQYDVSFLDLYEQEYDRLKDMLLRNPQRSLIMQYVRLVKALGKTPQSDLFLDIVKLRSEIANILDEGDTMVEDWIQRLNIYFGDHGKTIEENSTIRKLLNKVMTDPEYDIGENYRPIICYC